MKKKWTLDPVEVSSGFSGSSSGRTGVFARALKVTSRRVTLTHEPTGVSVVGDIPPGNYSKKTMQQLTDQLKSELSAALEVKVARHLNKPGW